MAGLGLYHTDCKSVLSQIKHQEKRMALKRRWLMGVPLSKSELKHLEGPKFLKKKVLRESMLREDDIFYETAKMNVEEAILSHDMERGCSGGAEIVKSSDMPNLLKEILSHLNDMTNKGLYHFAMIVTRGSVEFDKTRWKMKKLVRQTVRKVCHIEKNTQWDNVTFKKLYQLLNDPRNFRGNCLNHLAPTSHSQRAAALKLLGRLEELSMPALIAMYRKLRCVQGRVPRLEPFKSGRSRDDLIKKVRKTSRNMLLDLGSRDCIPEPLAKAMAIAVLSLKLASGFQRSAGMEFYQFAPEIRSLQDEIVKAVWLLNSKVRFQELKVFQSLLDPSAKVSNSRLRTAVKNVLTEYLFECSDLDVIPRSLLESLAFINRNSRTAPPSSFPKEEVEEEVECSLVVSAHMKQNVWDLLPEIGYDTDFANAYMEELEESDDDADSDYEDERHTRILKSGRSDNIDSLFPVEGTGESITDSSNLPFINIKGNGSSPSHTPRKVFYSAAAIKCEPDISPGIASTAAWYSSSSLLFQDSKSSEGLNGMDIDDLKPLSNFSSAKINSDGPFSFLSPNTGFAKSLKRHKAEDDELKNQQRDVLNRPSTCINRYLAVQEACDETSIIAYNLVGYILEEFAQREGLNLEMNESSYLGRDQSNEEGHEEKKDSSHHEGSEDFVIHRALENLVPCLKKSVMERLKECTGIP
ncbi:uncharacterized protein LOC130135800 [Syzygium oleosum]|uniref:uncharacterized protein LOC130135800 n=1 Tax=Syzygium oleosum TaxID=219896 RepID=UPI0024B93F05|nr:uncharacterized protein LOC130135800 [Syzygium oleosum]